MGDIKTQEGSQSLRDKHFFGDLKYHPQMVKSKHQGGVPRPAPPRKNDQNRGEVAGQNKGPNFNFLQQQNNITTLNNAQSGLSIGYARESKK